MAIDKSLENVCTEIVHQVNGALGCAVVDLMSGLPLAVHHAVPYFTQTFIDNAAAMSVEMFRGRGISTVEQLMSEQRGEECKHAIEEIQMTTKVTHHFMVQVPGKPNAMALLVTDRKANLGSGWSALRGALEKIAPACP